MPSQAAALPPPPASLSPAVPPAHAPRTPTHPRTLVTWSSQNIIQLKELIMPASMESFDDIFMVTDFMESDLRRVIKSKKDMAVPQVTSGRVWGRLGVK